LPIRVTLPHLRPIPTPHNAHDPRERSIGAAHLILDFFMVTGLAIPLAPDLNVQCITLSDQLIEVTNICCGDFLA
jgi:hypothetical protein